MTKRGVIRLFSIAAGLGVIAVSKYISNKGVEATLEKIQNNRSESDNKIFESYEEFCNREADILLKESVDAGKQMDAIKAAYNEANKRVDSILAKESVLESTEYRAISDACDAVKTKADIIGSREETLLKDLLKNDDAYVALKSASKALKKSGESTEKIDTKIQNRKDTIRNSIINSRTEEDKKTFEELDKLRRRLYDDTGRKASIKAARTDDEKAAFESLEHYRHKLYSGDDIKQVIRENRSEEDKYVFEQKDKLLKQIVEIENREKTSVNNKQAFADQLKSMGFNKQSVTILGLVPIIPVGILVSDYISWLFDLVRKM